MKSLAELTEREVLALAISSEEEDNRIYLAFAEDLAERYPASAKIFEERRTKRTVTAVGFLSFTNSASAPRYRRSGART
jgi:hypothetical protein